MQIQHNTFTSRKRRVSYFYNPQISKYTYSKQHPMKPQRIAMTHSLLVNYNLFRQLDVYSARQATKQQLKRFHSSDYIDYLQNYVSKDVVLKFGALGVGRFNSLINQQQRKNNLLNVHKRQKYKIGESTDCPGFPGLYNFCQLSTGASIDCATVIINNQTDIAINWGGGLHHAKKCQASGFCYTNDIVICILELLEIYPRVLYLDIDVHHGDGVEQAFFLTNRVMTVSFHQYSQEFFPGTGNIDSIGYSEGKYFALNVPLKMGMNDQCYFQIFKDVMKGVMDRYRPSVVVMQLGADSLAYDKLGQFNLSIKGHGACLNYMIGFGVPLIMLGGGGYTIENVARCWAYETGVALGVELEGSIPKNDPFYMKYGFDQKLHFPVKKMENLNRPDDLNKIRETIHEYLKKIQMSPGVQIHYVPRFTQWSVFLQDEQSTEYGQKTMNYE